MPETPIAVRTFRWEDIPALLALLGHQASSSHEERLRRWLRQPNMRPERDCLLAEAAGDAAGLRAYGYVVTEQAIDRGVLLLEGARGEAEAALVQAAERHAAGLGLKVLHVDVPEADESRQRLLGSRGFVYVRTHLHMRLTHATPLPVEPPGGMRLRMAERADALALTALQNAAFTGSWGYAPNTADEIEYRIFDLPMPDPDPVLLLEEEGGVMAYCWDHREGEGPGIVGMVAVHPRQQGRGLGRIVTAAGINHWLERGVSPIEITVDSDNTPAVRLYESLGFALDWRSLWYELRLA
ncbi:MAG: GNAT family N-acetyltransferase [Dehalococcoidia bacterium]